MKIKTLLFLAVIGVVGLYANSEANSSKDTRAVVAFPKELKEHTLTNMRHHLQAIDGILEALAKNDTDKAADIAEQQLGMSSLSLHGAHKASAYMPLAMRKAGMRLHHTASKFALIAPEGDNRKTFAALREVTLSCISCHAQFKFK